MSVSRTQKVLNSQRWPGHMRIVGGAFPHDATPYQYTCDPDVGKV